MSDAIILRRRGRKLYNWNRYNLNSTTTYTWNRYNIKTTTVYELKDTGSSYTARFNKGDIIYNSISVNNNGEIIFSGPVSIYNTSTCYGRYFRFGSDAVQIEYATYYMYNETYSCIGPVYTVSSTTEQSKGSSAGTVSSTSRNTYPNNGVSGNYWYVYSKSETTYSQGSFIDTITSEDRNAYPDNNHSSNYWYVYTGENRSGGGLRRLLAT